MMASPSPSRAPSATSESERVRTFLPDNPLHYGFIATLMAIATELRNNAWLLGLLLRRDIVAFYKQSLLGIFWVILVPLVTICSFAVLRSAGVFAHGGGEVPYAIYAGLGVLTWQLFAQGMTAGCRALSGNERILTRIRCSKKVLLISSYGRSWFTFTVGCLGLSLLIMVYHLVGVPLDLHVTGLLFPLAVLPIVAWTLALGFIISLLNALARDVAAAVTMAMPFLLLGTPILYDRDPANDASQGMQLLRTVTMDLNPLYHLVTGPRDLVLHGQLVHPQGFLAATLLSLLSLFAAVYLFHLAESRVIERI